MHPVIDDSAPYQRSFNQVSRALASAEPLRTGTFVSWSATEEEKLDYRVYREAGWPSYVETKDKSVPAPPKKGDPRRLSFLTATPENHYKWHAPQI